MGKPGLETKGKTKTPLKKFTVGFEVEFLIIDKNTGKPAPSVDVIIKKVDEKAGGKHHTVVNESGQELIELGSYPNVEGEHTMQSLLDNIKLLTYAADETGHAVLPLGTYPGKFSPHIVNKSRYRLYGKVFNKSQAKTWERCAGYHCHYSLPWGVFDKKKLILKDSAPEKSQERLVDAYNFLIALDPVLTTFMQSSPFYQGKHLAKDSRMLVLRSDEELSDFKGWHSGYPLFSVLPPYVHTSSDIMHLVRKQNTEWGQMCDEKKISEKEWEPLFHSPLKINWSPLRVNPHGTFEQRGMDMNRLPVLLSVSILIQILLGRIQEGRLKVVPHDSGKEDPFSLEKKTVYIAPDTYVRQHLQKISAYEGLANDEMHAYCKRAVQLARHFGGERIDVLLKPLIAMLAERETTADKILAQAKELGHKNLKKTLPESIAAEIALSYSKQMFEDIVLLEEMIEGLGEG